MKYLKIKLFIVCFFFASNGFSQNTISSNDEISYYISQLDSLVKANDYEYAVLLIDIIKNKKNIHPQVIQNCIDTYMGLKQYEECIDFCKHRLSLCPEDDFAMLYEALGESYYLLNDSENALEYLDIYVDYIENNDFTIPIYLSGMYANVLYENYFFEEAEKYFKIYLDSATKKENLSIDYLYRSNSMKIYGFIFYRLAYSLFFQGKETEGYKYLLLARTCGDKSADKDCIVLEKSTTFARDIKYKTGTIKEFEKYIQAFDPKIALTEVDSESFWKIVQENNKNYQEYYQALHSKKRPATLRKALAEVKENEDLLQQYLLPFDISELEESLIRILFGDKSFIKELRIYHGDQPNAFATPQGEIYLTDGLVKLYNFNETLLSGVCAHEVAHYIFQHTTIGLWKQAKKEKNNKIWAGIAAGLSTAAIGASAMYGASSGISYDQEYWDNVNIINNSFINSFKKDAYYFKFKYDRSQEIESDIIAYRFCESIGAGGYAYIMALQLLGNEADEYVTKESDHPSIAFRVGLLKYLYAKDHP